MDSNSIQQDPFQLIEQSLELVIDQAHKTISGSTTIRLLVNSPKTLRTVDLNARQLIIERVSINGTSAAFTCRNSVDLPIVSEIQKEVASLDTGTPFSSIHFCKLLDREIAAAHSVQSNAELSIFVPESVMELLAAEPSAIIQIDDSVQLAPDMKEPKCLEVTILFSLTQPKFGVFFNFAGTQCFSFNHYGMARYWLPSLDFQRFRCPWRIRIISIKQPLLAISVGSVVEHCHDPDRELFCTSFYQDVPISSCDVFFSLSPSQSQKIANFDLQVAFPSGEESKASHLEDFFIKAHEFYKWFLNSPFPYASPRVLFLSQFPTNGACYANVFVLNADLLYPSTVIGQGFVTRSVLSLLIARAYFSSFVFPKTGNDGWLVRGIAYYLSRQFLRLVFGTNDFIYQLRTDMEEICQSDTLKAPLYHFNPLDEEFNEFSQKKGSLVIHLIEKKIERPLLQKLFNSILMQSASGEVISGLSTHNFFKLIKKLTGKDLKPISDQWIFTAGCPVFTLSFSVNRTKNVVEASFRQQCSSNDHKFYGQLVVRVAEIEGVYDHVLQIDDSAHSFELPIYTRLKKRARKLAQKRQDDEQGFYQSTATNNEVDIDGGGDVANDDDGGEEEEQGGFSIGPIEWIIVDPDMLWIATFHISQHDFMWIGCLENERDVLCQHQAIKALSAIPSENTSVALSRVLGNWRNFFRIRTEAAASLSSCCKADLNMIGASKLFDYFVKRYCYPLSQKIPQNFYPVKPNNYETFSTCLIQRSVVLSLGILQPSNQQPVPETAFNILVSCLQMNDNSENSYSDVDYVGGILQGITLAIENPNDSNVLNHLPYLVLELERILFLDKLFPTHQLANTVAAISLLKRLQTFQYLPIDLSFYLEYCQSSFPVDVRLSAIEALSFFAFDQEAIILQLLELSSSFDDLRIRSVIPRFLSQAALLHPLAVAKYASSEKVRKVCESFVLGNYNFQQVKDFLPFCSTVFPQFGIAALEENDDDVAEDDPLEFDEMRDIAEAPEADTEISKLSASHRNRQGLFPIDTPDDLQTLISHIINRLYATPASFSFRLPVDSETPFYYDIIEHPMDLSKISSTQYQGLYDFWNDVVLMLRNCLCFNDHHSAVVNCAKMLRSVLYREIRKSCPYAEQSTLLAILRKGTDISPDTPLIRYCLVLLIGHASSQRYREELAEFRSRVDSSLLCDFDSFVSMVLQLASPTESNSDHLFLQYFDELLSSIGKKKSANVGRARRRVVSVIDDLISKTRLPRGDSQQSTDSAESIAHSFCMEIVEKMQASNHSIWFRFPVDISTTPNYYETISRPIDLSEISRKLKSFHYENVEAFEADVALLFDNCYQFNNEKSQVHSDGKFLERFFVREWIKLKDKIKQSITSANAQAHRSGNILFDYDRSYHPLRKPQLEQALRYVLFLLSTQTSTEPFIYPVSREIPNYYTLINEPISLIQIQERCADSKYSIYREFECDLELLLRNCYHFNQSSSFVYQSGRRVETFYLEEVRPKLENRKFLSFACSISDGEATKIRNSDERLCSAMEAQIISSRVPALPFTLQSLKKKFEFGLYSTFMEYDRDVRAFFTIAKEWSAPDNECLDCLQVLQRYYEESMQDRPRLTSNPVSVSPSKKAAVIPKIRVLPLKLSSSTSAPVDISKIPPTPTKFSTSALASTASPVLTLVARYEPPTVDQNIAQIFLDDRSLTLLRLFMEKLLKQKHCVHFATPVDFVALSIPDYPRLILEPMDFGTIYRQLQAGKYQSLGLFKRDLDLVTYNCIFFNHQTLPITKSAVKIREFVEKEFSDLRRKISAIPLPTISVDLTFQSDQDRDLALSMLEQLMKLECASWFLEPVDCSLPGMQAYLHIIRNPIDFGTIYKHLLAGSRYDSLAKVTQDIYQVFFNCFAFNLIESPVYKDGIKCRDFFESQILPRIPARPSASTPIDPRVAHSFVEMLLSHPLSVPFREPVDVEVLGIPKYRDMIRRPMDLGTLFKMEVCTEEELLESLNLIFDNCCKFNQQHSDLWRTSRILQEFTLAAWGIYKMNGNSQKHRTVLEMERALIAQLLESVMQQPDSRAFLQVSYPPHYLFSLETLLKNVRSGETQDPKLIVAHFKSLHKAVIRKHGKESAECAIVSKIADMVEDRLARMFSIRKGNK